MPRLRWILHADMDAFFASVEIRDRPELRGLPVIVGGLSNRGVVSAASYEARKFGVYSAMPMFQARERCPNAVVISPDMERYAEESAKIHELFYEVTPEIEPIALDEAFLDITGSLALLGEPLEIGRKLKARVQETTGLCVSVGIAANKLVAKVACTLGKPDGLKLVPRGQERALLAPLPVRRLWGIGPVAAASLERAGIRQIGELAQCSEAMLVPWLGKRSLEVIALARGIDERPVVPSRQAKSYGEECTFERDLSEREVMVSVLTAHAEAVARRMRHDECEGRTVTLKVRLGKGQGTRPARVGTSKHGPVYQLITRSRSLDQHTAAGSLIADTAVSLWDELDLGQAVRLVGVSMSGLREAGKGQLTLFAERRRDPRVGAALDAIEARFGRGIIHRGAASPDKLSPSVQRKRGE